jgi:CO/xanthine dehydrogenase Mo-binding subunit
VTLIEERHRAGVGIPRVDGVEKVTGRARYAFEHPVDNVAYAMPITSTIAKGRITSIDDEAARSRPGVLTVITPDNAPACPAMTTLNSRCSRPATSPTAASSLRQSSRRRWRRHMTRRNSFRSTTRPSPTT